MHANGRGAMRGQWRGRGRGRGGQSWTQPTPIVRPPSPPSGSIIEIVNRNDLTDMALSVRETPAISGCKAIASFNWTESKKPSVIMPGLPPAWKPLDEPIQLQEDAGDYFRDQNAAHFPDAPMEAAVKALLTQNEDFDKSDVDVFACGSTMGNLLRFVRGEDKPFRFTVEAVDKTVFFVRRENAPDEIIQGVRGYGHAFPEKYTEWTPAVNCSVSHQRLISYEFAGLKCIVRFEGDGYLEDLLDKLGNDTQGLASNRLDPHDDSLQLRTAGRMIPQEAIFDLKTRSAKRKDEDHLEAELPRLWVSQIPNFILAFHEWGTFHDHNIHVRDVRKEIKDWETKHTDEICQMAALLHKIIKFTRTEPEGKCEIRRREVNTLEIREKLDDAPPPMLAQTRQAWIDTSAEHDDDDGVVVAGADASSAESNGSEEAGVDLASFSDDDEKDLTACTPECGYCGHC